MTLLELHLVLVSFWFGVLAVEAVLELCARDAASRRTVALVHRWTDLLVEIPTALAVLVTGAVLLARAWPAPSLLLVKSGLGLSVVVAQLVSVPLVHARWKADDDARVEALTRRITAFGAIYPVAIATFILGLYWTGH